jgi:hypothetical protein
VEKLCIRNYRTNLEVKDLGVFQGTIPALAWKDKEGRNENPHSF